MDIQNIEEKIVDVPDFPKPGVIFKDITPVLEDPKYFNSLLDHFESKITEEFDSFVAIESRGFIFGAALAERMNKGLILIRKPGKLPREVEKQTYQLEYGTDELQAHKASFVDQPRVYVIDDVLATGGTAQAAENLCRKLGAKICGHLFLMQLDFLQGWEKLECPHQSLISVK